MDNISDVKGSSTYPSINQSISRKTVRTQVSLSSMIKKLPLRALHHENSLTYFFRNRFLSTKANNNLSHEPNGSRPNRALLINGRAMAYEILSEVRRDVEEMRERGEDIPGLATILVGERRDSEKYVMMKHAVAKHVGFRNFSTRLPASVSMEEVIDEIERYNRDARCHGILLQLPLPPHLDAQTLLGTIRVEKDVECFHPLNTGRLSCWRHTVVSPCTPRGIMEMLSRIGVKVKGKQTVVVGESNVVGLPMVLMLNAEKATVSLIHKDTSNPKFYTRAADIVIAAAGVPFLVKKDWIKRGAVVIDVGINFVRDSSRKEGFRMVGDVSPCVRTKASIVSPVPGGVGPMTVAMLMKNCIDMAQLRLKWKSIASVINPSIAAENSRGIQGAVLDMGLGDVDVEDQSEFHNEEMHEILEEAGASISEAELLTIFNDTEKNAYNVLSFLELGSNHDWVVRHRIESKLRTEAWCDHAGSLDPNDENRRMLLAEDELQVQSNKWWLDKSHRRACKPDSS